MHVPSPILLLFKPDAPAGTGVGTVSRGFRVANLIQLRGKCGASEGCGDVAAVHVGVLGACADAIRHTESDLGW